MQMRSTHKTEEKNNRNNASVVLSIQQRKRKKCNIGILMLSVRVYAENNCSVCGKLMSAGNRNVCLNEMSVCVIVRFVLLFRGRGLCGRWSRIWGVRLSFGGYGDSPLSISIPLYSSSSLWCCWIWDRLFHHHLPRSFPREYFPVDGKLSRYIHHIVWLSPPIPLMPVLHIAIENGHSAQVAFQQMVSNEWDP